MLFQARLSWLKIGERISVYGNDSNIVLNIRAYGSFLFQFAHHCVKKEERRPFDRTWGGMSAFAGGQIAVRKSIGYDKAFIIDNREVTLDSLIRRI